MEELQLVSRQHPGEVVIDNFLEMKDALAQVLARYENVVYTEDMTPEIISNLLPTTHTQKISVSTTISTGTNIASA